MLGGGFYGFFEVGGYAGFGDVAADAGLGGVAGEVEGFEVGDDEDFGFGGVAADEFGGGEAVHGGHGDVQEDHVGLQLGGFCYGVAAVFGFAADLPFGVKLEEHFQAGAYGQAVVCDEDADFGHGLLGSVFSARYQGYFTNGARKCTSGVPCRWWGGVHGGSPRGRKWARRRRGVGCCALARVKCWDILQGRLAGCSVWRAAGGLRCARGWASRL